MMITHEAYPVEPWQVRETRLDLNLLAQFRNGHHVIACQCQRRYNHQNTEQNVIFLIVYSPM